MVEKLVGCPFMYGGVFGKCGGFQSMFMKYWGKFVEIEDRSITK